MIDWINLIAGIILGAASSSLIFWLTYGTKLDKLSKSFKAFSKYVTNIPPTYCQYCNKDAQFRLASQTFTAPGKLVNNYICPHCGNKTMQQI